MSNVRPVMKLGAVEEYTLTEEERGWFEVGIQRLVAAFTAAGHTCTEESAIIMWTDRSLDWDAGWLEMPQPGGDDSQLVEYLKEYYTVEEPPALTEEQRRELNEALFTKLEDRSDPVVSRAGDAINDWTRKMMFGYPPPRVGGKDAQAERPGSPVPPPQQ